MLTLVEASQQAASLDSDELDDLVAARREAERAKDMIDVRKQRLIASRERVATISTEISGTLEERRLALEQMSNRLADLERLARRAAAQEPGPGALARLLAGTGPSGSGPSNGIPAGFVGTGVTFEGIASWYGPGFEGNHTANGDIFDSSLFTAASKTLPLGSWLYVEHGGRGVVVYVNDRGPYAGDRILDLSQAAAQAIGISGLGWIEAEVVLKK
jgi:rare lipoprotein A